MNDGEMGFLVISVGLSILILGLAWLVATTDK